MEEMLVQGGTETTGSPEFNFKQCILLTSKRQTVLRSFSRCFSLLVENERKHCSVQAERKIKSCRLLLRVI